MMKKWKLKSLTTLLAAGLVLAACTGGGGEPTPVPGPGGITPTPSPGTVTPPEPTLTVGVIQTAPPSPTASGAGAVPETGESAIPETGDQASIPPEVEQANAQGEWPMANKDYASTRAALDAEINSSNVNELGLAWAFPIPGRGTYGGAATNPIVANGVVYFQDLGSNVHALDLETGELIWEHRIAQNALGPNGVALGYGKIFAQGAENQLAALDIQTGEEVWVASLEGPTGAQQPYVYNGHVYTAAVAGAVQTEVAGDVSSRRGYAPGTSGIIYAIDEATGEMAWRFQVIEEGFWGNPEINGGGGVWYPPAIDTQTGLTFWGTGNPAPFPGIVGWPNAASRPGPNLYTSAVVALDHLTGELLWYNQAKPHDLFDLDFQITPILAGVDIDGQPREIVIGSGKVGRILAIDRETGETLWDTPVGFHQNDELDEIPEGEEIMVFPGAWGGVETPMALADGVLFANVLNLGTPYTADAFGAADGIEAVSNATGRMQLNEGTSELVAIDIQTGEILWNVEYDQPAFGAATVVNDLVFTSTMDGVIRAHAREDGREVWTYEASGGINAWPAVSGDTILFPVGIGEQPVLIALRLGAEGAEVPEPGPTLPPTPVR